MKSTELVADLMSWTLIAVGRAARVTTAVFSGAKINIPRRVALAGLNGGENGGNGDDGSKESHSGLDRRLNRGTAMISIVVV